MQEVKVVFTKDGSKTLYVPNLDEHYHSIHGAINEARHVYIKHGLKPLTQSSLKVLEVGFGTGLNTFLTFIESLETRQNIDYVAVENSPLNYDFIEPLEYPVQLEVKKYESIFKHMHDCHWNEQIFVSNNFFLNKHYGSIETLKLDKSIDLVFYDAFGPRAQKEMWTKDCFYCLTHFLNNNAILVTYCANGQVKRTLKDIGFMVETLDGPPGKREMIRAKWMA